MRLLKRGPMETMTVEPFSSVDSQGAPSYSTGHAIDARVVEEDAVVRTGDGSEVRTTLTAWVDSDEILLPVERDRVSVGDSAYIVVERQAPKRLMSGEVDHVRLRCREE